METRLTPADFESLRAERLASDPRYGTIAEVLRKLFWDDTCTDVTIRFYERLQNEAIIHGNPVRRHIKSVAAAAQSKDHPVRYFAASITRRLNEQGYLRDGGEDLGL
jgi:hypothetical protein